MITFYDEESSESSIEEVSGSAADDALGTLIMDMYGAESLAHLSEDRPSDQSTSEADSSISFNFDHADMVKRSLRDSFLKDEAPSIWDGYVLW